MDLFLDNAVRVLYLFVTEMEIHTPSAAERYTTIKGRMCARLDAEGPRYNIARMVDLLILELLTWMIDWSISRAEQRLQEQACQDDVVSEPELAGGFVATCGDGGDERRGDAIARAGRGRAVVRVIAPAADPGASSEACVRGEGGARGAYGRWDLAANLATMGRGVSALDDGCLVFEVLFAKTELRIGWNCV